MPQPLAALPPSPSPSSIKALIVLRLLLWITPGVLIPVCVFFAPTLSTPHIPPPVIIIFFISFSIVAIFTLGIFDSFLSESVPKQEHRPSVKGACSHGFFFLMSQYVFAPFVALVTLIVLIVFAIFDQITLGFIT